MSRSGRFGTGSTATPNQAQEAHAIIRREVAATLGEARAESTRILYGGSVKPENTATLMTQPDIERRWWAARALIRRRFAGS